MTSGQQPVIELADVVRRYGTGAEQVVALNGASLRVNRGEFVAIMGPSGSGKSTLLHVIGGLDRPDEGRVLLEGRDISALSHRDLAVLRRRRLGFVLQVYNLFPAMTTLDNVSFPLRLDRVLDAKDQARVALHSVGLGHRLNHKPHELSAGEEQRVALARALITKPAVVLADEPTGNLDSRTGEEVLHLLREAADEGQTVVVVTHDEKVSRRADRVIRMSDGYLSE